MSVVFPHDKQWWSSGSARPSRIINWWPRHEIHGASTWHHTKFMSIKHELGHWIIPAGNGIGFGGTFPAIDESFSVGLWKTCCDLWLTVSSETDTVKETSSECLFHASVRRRAHKGDWTSNHISSLHIRHIIAIFEAGHRCWWVTHSIRERTTSQHLSLGRWGCLFKAKLSVLFSFIPKIQSFSITAFLWYNLISSKWCLRNMSVSSAVCRAIQVADGPHWENGSGVKCVTLQFTVSPADGAQARRPAHWSATEPVL